MTSSKGRGQGGITREEEVYNNTAYEDVHRYKSNKATVEVTVKVKKRRDGQNNNYHDKKLVVEQNYRKGSWGDLLSRHKSSDTKEVVSKEKQVQTHKKYFFDKDRQEVIKTCEGGGDAPRSICHKIPISSELYLETQTVVRNKSDLPKSSKTQPYDKVKMWRKTIDQDNVDDQKTLNYEAQNDYLRYEIERLKQDIEQVKINALKKSPPSTSTKSTGVGSSSIIKKTGVPIKQKRNEKERGKDIIKQQKGSGTIQNSVPSIKRSQQKMTSSSTANIPITTRNYSTNSNHRSSAILTPVKEAATSTSVSNLDEIEKEVELRLENEVLRKEAAGLLAQMEKAKQEQQESIMTIKELYQLAELLKRENQQLIGTQEEQHLLQEKLVSVVSENQELKQYLESVMKKHKESTVQKGDQMNQLEKIRNVIQEVKSTIQDEIKGISSNSSGSMAHKESLRCFNFNIAEGDSALLNDTNASEIQRILGSYENSVAARNQSQDYLDGVKGYLSPPPGPGSQMQRQKTSTPDPSRSKSREQLISTAQEDLSKLVESFQEDVSRSFRPIQEELANTSTSSEYRSTS